MFDEFTDIVEGVEELDVPDDGVASRNRAIDGSCNCPDVTLCCSST